MCKKILFATSLLAALSLTGCKEDFKDWAAVQSSQEEAMGDISVKLSAAPGAVVIKDVVDGTSSDTLSLATISAPGADLTDARFVRATFDDNVLPVILSEDGREISISKLKLDSVVRAYYVSRSSEQRTLPVEVEYFVKRKNGSAYSKTVETNIVFNAMPTPAEDPKGYFLLGNFVGNDWDATKPIWMNNDGGGIYSVTVETSGEGDNWYKYYAGSNFVSGNWDEINKGQMGCRVNGDNSLLNFVVWTGDMYNVETPVISGKGKWDITLDVKNMVYSVQAHSDLLYLPGSSNGWGFEMDILSDNGNGVCEGYAVLGGEWGWKVTVGPGWDNQYGDGGEPGKLVQNGGNIMEGSVATPYRVSVNLKELTYSLTEITSWSLIGSVIDDSWSQDVDLKPSEDFRSWSVTTALKAGEFKIRMNHDWAYSLGGSFDSMTDNNGANLTLAEDGTYTITFYPSYNGASHCTVVKN